MKVRALRGVCIGVNRDLALDDEAELDPATGKFLVSIGAVEEVKPPPPAPAPEPKDPQPSSETKSTNDAGAEGGKTTDAASNESSPEVDDKAEEDEPERSDSSGGTSTQPRRGRRK